MKMFKLLIVLTLLCGVIYPLTITVIAQVLFPNESNGSLLIKEGKLIGSELLAQKFSRAEFFHPRPSAADYATVASGASQSSPTQKSGTDSREQRRAQHPTAGVDFWTTSGSGLDPHISPETAYAQVHRVAAARGTSEEFIKSLISQHIEGPTIGIWGQPRVNVLKLNLVLMSQGTNANTR
jgi:K+-transporting ATPase ATPase C chain